MHKDINPIDLAIVAVIGLLQATWELFRLIAPPLIALILILVGWTPQAVDQPAQVSSTVEQIAPHVHPIAVIATDLMQHSRNELMALVGTKKKLTKAQLIGTLVAN